MSQRSIVVGRDESLFLDVLDELQRAGHHLQAGWVVDEGPGRVAGPDTTYFGRVETGGQAHAALLAAIGGASLVVYVPAADRFASFLDDLGRVGELEIRANRRASPLLDKEQRSLLQLLAKGSTVAEASRELNLSLRTAQRRLAVSRAALGARSTGEAVHIARSRGLC